MRIIVAFDFMEEDANAIEILVNRLLEDLSERTLVWSTYDSDKYWLDEKIPLSSLSKDFLLKALLDRAVNMIGNDDEEHLIDVLDIGIFADRISELDIEKRYGE